MHNIGVIQDIDNGHGCNTPGGLIIDANKYFDKAKAEMLERKKNIELRLVSVDEPPQKRRELRAEMKGIDFCISVLDANR